VVVCGNGIGAGGTGSDAVCGAEVQSSAPESPPVMEFGPNVEAVPTAAEAAASAAAAGGASSTSSSGALPRTGASTLAVLGIGAAMVAMGMVAVRLRRRLT
jgi:LPXTG-motif cell wall-anchored protein